ncbi:CPXCG motif-containing cysteine-rich protein [Gallaecimonas sp. GXIMD1310]|uniref:CPXCG motif-containing cysteine-rich protein n=1 Tax=Gallaecimonas sp. GXIMD1310 TaxID=3131926 RepID=UPI003251EA4F
MDAVRDFRVICPNCGHPTYITVEPEDVGQDFVEDCANCCNAIHITVSEDEKQQVSVSVDGEDEQLY